MILRYVRSAASTRDADVSALTKMVALRKGIGTVVQSAAYARISRGAATAMLSRATGTTSLSNAKKPLPPIGGGSGLRLE